MYMDEYQRWLSCPLEDAALSRELKEIQGQEEQIKERFGTKTVYINYIGPVIGSHTGPNTLGIFFVGTQR